MSLKAILESLEGLDDSISSLYVERDGVYVLDVQAVNGFALENVENLKSALQKERAAHSSAKSKLSQFADIDPDAARDALSKVDEIQNWTPDQKVQEKMEAQRKQMLTAHEAEKEKLQQTIAAHRKQLEESLITSAATKALSEAKGSPELMLPHVKAATRMRQADNGEFVVEVVDADGIARVNGDGKNMTISQLVDEMKSVSVYARAFEGSGASGSGTSGSSGGDVRRDLSKLSPAERLKAHRGG